MYKVCILAAGVTRRVGDMSDYVNKAILPVNNKAVISYLIERFPADIEFVVAVGHRKDTVMEYLRFAYPERKFTFVEIEKYVGEGTGPATTLLECRDHLQCPFILATADTIVLEDIPAPTENWIGVAPIAPEKADQYCTVRRAGDHVTGLDVKIRVPNTHAFIGLAGIRDAGAFFLALQANRQSVRGEVQISTGLQELIDASIPLQAHEFTWFDTGTIEGFTAANRHYTPAGAFDFSKADEFLYFVNGRVLKFFADEKITQHRIARAEILDGLCPPLTGKGTNFYAYEMVPGKVLYDILDKEIARAFFQWARDNLWTARRLTIEEQGAFDRACRKFYHDKTLERIKKFFAKTNLPDVTTVIDGETVMPLSELLEHLDWEELYSGIPSRMHGDLQFDNIILRDGTTDGFFLLDWRQDFAGMLEYGDRYYDLAKLYGGMIISYKGIKENRFSIKEERGKVSIDLHETKQLREAREAFEEFLIAQGYDLGKVRRITALIFLNMAPLHHAPFDVLLYHLGRRELQRALDRTQTVTETTVGFAPDLRTAHTPQTDAPVTPVAIGLQAQTAPRLCLGPMSRTIVDTVIAYAHLTGTPISLIASRSQVETAALGGGYANNWSTEDFAAYVRQRLKETPADVLVCRDHGGPWLGADEKSLAYKYAMLSAKASFEADIASGFNMIHIDTSQNPLGAFDMEAALARAFELLLFCEEKAAQYGNRVQYEIGTEDADGGIVEPEAFEEFLKRIVEFCEARGIPKPRYIVGRTGTFVRETRQHGYFHYENTIDVVRIARKYGVGIKEHNVDYDHPESLKLRAKAGVAAINVAPEFGHLETMQLLRHMQRIGRQDLYDQFIDLAYGSKKWKKWLCDPDLTSKEHKAVIAGHYVFGTPEFQAIKAQLHPDHEEEVRRVIWENIDWYVRHLRHGTALEGTAVAYIPASRSADEPSVED